ncbi:MAG TPA: hypothetical protein VMG12_35670 [Polyangiaceae bacterium]|nr:hypothetical protein [Polyangiaceae bacterium]
MNAPVDTSASRRGAAQALAERIQAKAPELGQRAIAEMYQNPFWQERFGAYGREMSDKDSQFHVSYVVQALVASEPAVLTNYARWLQTLLVSRGMCSRHIDENFERLSSAIGHEIAEPGPALELLAAAREALVYASGPARELMLTAETLAERVVDALWTRVPTWFSAASTYPSLATFESIHQVERARFKSDALEYISYLADALHAERPELFVEHAVWMHDFTVRRHGPGARVEETLHTLADCLPPAPAAPKASRPPGGASAAASGADRASQRPSRRPPLSQPPPPPVPVPVSGELAGRARAVLDAALERLAREAENAVLHAARAATRAADGGNS